MLTVKLGDSSDFYCYQFSKILGKSAKKLEEFIDLRMLIFENNCYEIRNCRKYQSAGKL